MGRYTKTVAAITPQTISGERLSRVMAASARILPQTEGGHHRAAVFSELQRLGRYLGQAEGVLLIAVITVRVLLRAGGFGIQGAQAPVVDRVPQRQHLFHIVCVAEDQPGVICTALHRAGGAADEQEYGFARHARRQGDPGWASYPRLK